MPIYEYECAKCELVHTSIFKKAHDVQIEYYYCKRCERVTKHQRIISQSSFHLRGKGWARDGYIDPTSGMPSGDKFIEQYRKEIADPEHPRKVGDILKSMGRGNGHDDLSDIGCSIRDLDAARHNKLHTGNEANLVRPKPSDEPGGDTE